MRAVWTLSRTTKLLTTKLMLMTVSILPRKDVLVGAAIAFRNNFVFHNKLVLSSKSTVVANPSRLAKAIQAESGQYGIEVRAVEASRDLGPLFNASRKRDLSIARERRGKALKRMVRIDGLAKRNRSARRLFTFGAYP